MLYIVRIYISTFEIFQLKVKTQMYREIRLLRTKDCAEGSPYQDKDPKYTKKTMQEWHRDNSVTSQSSIICRELQNIPKYRCAKLVLS